MTRVEHQRLVFPQGLTPILDTYVLQWMGERWTSLFEQYTLLWMSETPSMVIAFTSNVRFDVPVTRELMAVCQGAGNFGTYPDFSDCAGVPRTKIRAESSSNGSEVRGARFPSHKIRAELSSNGSQLKLRTASFTPHFHAELL